MTHPSITPTLIRELLEIAADRPLPDFKMSHSLWEDIGLDSYGALCLQLEVKKVLAIEIAKERFPEIMTGQDLADELERLLGPEAASAATSAATEVDVVVA